VERPLPRGYSAACYIGQLCIPPHLNPHLDVKTWLKRLKLSFSKIIARVQLPPDSVKVLPDFSLPGIVEPDGCGLISAEMLEFVKRESNCQDKASTGCQFRLGGCKGTLILDNSLKGKVIHCRRSQVKYDTLSVTETSPSMLSSEWAELSNTLEIVSWDTANANGATTNRRFIQCLEASAEDVHALKDVLKTYMDAAIDEFKTMTVSDTRLRHQKASMATSNASQETQYDGALLFDMLSCDAPSKDPELCRRAKRVFEKRVSELRGKVNITRPSQTLRFMAPKFAPSSTIQQAKYPIRDSSYLRMSADPTLLLRPGEAFLATTSPIGVQEIVAFRNPSYFKGGMFSLFYEFAKHALT
jgi:hypothetical protein